MSRGDPIQITLRAGEDLEEQLRPRLDAVSHARRIKRDLKRYYRLLGHARAGLRDLFSGDELLIIAAMLQDDPFATWDDRALHLLVRERGEGRISEATLRTLIYKVRYLADAHRLALIDAIEQARSQTWTGPEDSLRARFRRLNLCD